MVVRNVLYQLAVVMLSSVGLGSFFCFVLFFVNIVRNRMKVSPCVS